MVMNLKLSSSIRMDCPLGVLGFIYTLRRVTKPATSTLMCGGKKLLVQKKCEVKQAHLVCCRLTLDLRKRSLRRG